MISGQFMIHRLPLNVFRPFWDSSDSRIRLTHYRAFWGDQTGRLVAKKIAFFDVWYIYIPRFNGSLLGKLVGKYIPFPRILYSIKNEMGPEPNGPRSVSYDRAVVYSGCFGVRSTWVLLVLGYLGIELEHHFFQQIQPSWWPPRKVMDTFSHVQRLFQHTPRAHPRQSPVRQLWKKTLFSLLVKV